MDAKLKLALVALVVVGLCSTLALWRDLSSETTVPALAFESPRPLEPAEPMPSLVASSKSA